jgi:hypothetical protein
MFNRLYGGDIFQGIPVTVFYGKYVSAGGRIRVQFDLLSSAFFQS